MTWTWIRVQRCSDSGDMSQGSAVQMRNPCSPVSRPSVHLYLTILLWGRRPDDPVATAVDLDRGFVERAASAERSVNSTKDSKRLRMSRP